jgi:predicted lipopolysaccharide heptosyltransferase III
MRNILVVKLRYVGDVLLATPVLRALKDRFPDARITMAVNNGTEDVLRWNPNLDEVLVLRRGGPREELRFLLDLRRRRFDLVIDLTDGDRSAFLSRWTGAATRIGFNREQRWRGAFYTTVVAPAPGLHRIERNLETLRPLGIEPKTATPGLWLSAEDERRAAGLLKEFGATDARGTITRPLIMLHPGARYWFKSWPIERFAALADRLVDTYGGRVLIGGSDLDEAAAAGIAGAARSKPINLAGRAGLLTFAAVVKQCAVFIGNDNGAMHIAAAIGTPVVGLFGPSNPREWGPRGDRVAVVYKGLDCRACFHPTCERGEGNCMRQIGVEEVFAASSGLLSSGGDAARAGGRS